MSKKWKLESGKSGLTAADRRILAGATAATADPALSSDGYSTQQNDEFHLLFNVGGTDPVFGLQLWWYATTSAQWHKGEALTVQSNDVVSIEINGLERVYLQVTSASGTTPTLDAWLALVVQAS